MRQRREDARNIALIVGSGVLGAVAALVGVSLMGSSAEVRDHSARWEVIEVRPDRFRAEISFRDMRERPVEPHRVLHSFEHSRAVAEAVARHAELQARLEAVQSSRRDLEGTITRVQVRAVDPGAAPVIYVDGVRFDGAMEDLSPDDIESVDVIKGDAAIEAYGKEGENGVIIIKKRKPGKKRKGGGRR